MKKFQFNYASEDNISIIRAIKWVPDGKIKGAIQIVTGINDTINRYNKIGEALSENGYIVYGCDLIGCGKSDNYRHGLKHDYKYSFDSIAADIYKCNHIILNEYNLKESIIMGVSLGCSIVKKILSERTFRYMNAILIGAYSNDKVRLYTDYIRLAGSSIPDGYFSKVASKIYSRDFNSGNLYVNENFLEEYLFHTDLDIDNPIGLMREILKYERESLLYKNMSNIPNIAKILVICGSEDKHRKALTDYVYKLNSMGKTNINFHVIPGYKHEVINEACSSMTLNIIKNWLNKVEYIK